MISGGDWQYIHNEESYQHLKKGRYIQQDEYKELKETGWYWVTYSAWRSHPQLRWYIWKPETLKNHIEDQQLDQRLRLEEIESVGNGDTPWCFEWPF